MINLGLGSLSRTRIMAAIGAILTCKPQIPDDPIEARATTPASRSTSTPLPKVPTACWRWALASFSNSGSWIEIAAPGVGLTSSMPGGNWASWSGTSMAAPLVSGVAALLRAREPQLTPKDVIVRLKNTTSVLCGGTNIGQVDAAAALTNVPQPRFRCN